MRTCVGAQYREQRQQPSATPAGATSAKRIISRVRARVWVVCRMNVCWMLLPGTMNTWSCFPHSLEHTHTTHACLSFLVIHPPHNQRPLPPYTPQAEDVCLHARALRCIVAIIEVLATRRHRLVRVLSGFSPLYTRICVHTHSLALSVRVNARAHVMNALHATSHRRRLHAAPSLVPCERSPALVRRSSFINSCRARWRIGHHHRHNPPPWIAHKANKNIITLHIVCDVGDDADDNTRGAVERTPNSAGARGTARTHDMVYACACVGAVGRASCSNNSAWLFVMLGQMLDKCCWATVRRRPPRVQFSHSPRADGAANAGAHGACAPLCSRGIFINRLHLACAWHVPLWFWWLFSWVCVMQMGWGWAKGLRIVLWKWCTHAPTSVDVQVGRTWLLCLRTR